MAIIPVPSGAVVVKIPVDFEVASLAELTTEVGANPNLYSDKAFLARDTGLYHHVDGNDGIKEDVNYLPASFVSNDGQIDFTSGRVDVNITGTELQLNPGGDINLAAFVVITNNTGNTRNVDGIKAPVGFKKLSFYVDGNASVRFRNNRGTADIKDRLDIGGNTSVNAKGIITFWYDTITQKWKNG